MSLSPRQLEQLFQDLEDGCISAADHAALMKLIVEDPAVRLKYCKHMAFAGAMHSEAGAQAELEGWTHQAAEPKREGRLFANSLLAAAAVLLLAALALAVIQLSNARPDVVRIAAPQGAAWAVTDVSGDGTSADSLREGSTVEVRSGMVSFTLESGSRMIVQGPARVSFPAFHRPSVESGMLWIDTVPGDEPMQVTAAGWMFQDIGTRFGVRARADGRAELHVIEGSVRASGPGGSFEMPASKEAAIITSTESREPVVRDPDPFPDLTSLLKRPRRYSTTVLGQSPSGYWGLERTIGGSLANRVAGDFPGKADQLVQFGGAGPRPDDGFAGFAGTNDGAFLPGNSENSVIYDIGGEKGVSPVEGAVSLWFRRAPDLNHREVLWFAGSEKGIGREIQIFLVKGGRLQLFVENGGKNILLSTGRTVHDDRWHHVAASWGSDRVTLYLDGNRVAGDEGVRLAESARFRGTNVRAGKVGLNAVMKGGGSEFWNVNDAFTGHMDEIALWNRPLSDEEVQRQFESAVGGSD